ncbi:hypothetical protein predicted by Glimmer/Critica [Sorangium cellulosum So ce56]|uniref:Uncharacterized protein n=1 Tax=Sorangium cellulosum (strain So ce56) TaxID=448385 RepID=A9EUE8_SORC5|nr:hypothetical protein predicted by Glimmer/Critica [Sorangium cellulosum So ce56]
MAEARARLEQLLVRDPGALAAEERLYLIDVLALLAVPVFEDPDYLVMEAASGAERSHEGSL